MVSIVDCTTVKFVINNGCQYQVLTNRPDLCNLMVQHLQNVLWQCMSWQMELNSPPQYWHLLKNTKRNNIVRPYPLHSSNCLPACLHTPHPQQEKDSMTERENEILHANVTAILLPVKGVHLTIENKRCVTLWGREYTVLYNNTIEPLLTWNGITFTPSVSVILIITPLTQPATRS